MASKNSSAETGQSHKQSRGHLQRDNIAQAGLELMHQIGLDALTLRRLADELHVQAPALYWHFKNKQELLDEMAEMMLRAAFPSEPDVEALRQLEWPDMLLTMARTMRNTLLTYNDGAYLLAYADISKVAILSLELILAELIKAGFSYRAALIGILTLVNYTIGITFEEQSAAKHNTSQAEGIEAVRKVIIEQGLRHLASAFEENIAPFDNDAEFEAGVQLIIDGLRTRR